MRMAVVNKVRSKALVVVMLLVNAVAPVVAAEDGDENPNLETVEVFGRRTADEIGAGVLGERSVIETPFSVIGYTARLILDQGARSTSEVLANDPAIRVQGAGDGNYDFFSIRGFSVAASVFSLNGLYGVLPWNTLSPEMVEQFEIIGPVFRKFQPDVADALGEIAKDEARHLLYCRAIAKRYAPDEATREARLVAFREAEASAFREHQQRGVRHILSSGYLPPGKAWFWRNTVLLLEKRNDLPYTQFYGTTGGEIARAA